MAVTIVDTHVHAGRAWYEPIETILFQMDRNGVSKAVLIQYRGQLDNSYELACVREFPGRFAAVGMVDSEDPRAPEHLEELAQQGAAGVRFYAHERASGSDGRTLWWEAGRLGLVVSCLGTLQEFASPDFRRLVEAVPDTQIVIEHLAGATPQFDEYLYHQAMELAAYPNTYIKFGGFGEIAPRPLPFVDPPFQEVPPALRLAYEAFGASRMMWGSDFPPSGAREGYGNALSFPMQMASFFSQEEREMAFGGTALKVWRF